METTTTQSAAHEDHAKTLATLPDGLLTKALAFLDPSSLFAAAQVSHKWNSLASADNIWEKYVQYVTVPPTGAWKPKGRKTPEPDERRDPDDEKEIKEQKGGEKEKEKKEPSQKWDPSKALQWLRQQSDEGRPRVLGGVNYEVEGMKDQEIAKRKNKEIFRQHAGRGWYLPGFNYVTKPDGARVQLAPGKDNDEKFKVVVDNKPVFRVATKSPTSGFWFERLFGKEAAYDASNDFEKSLKGLGAALGLQDKLRKGNLRVDTKTLNNLATLFPTGKYDVASVQVWPQLMKCGTNEHPETGTRGDYWRHEWTKEGWGCTGVPENERYYRCWTHTRLLNWAIEVEDSKLPGLDVIFNAFVIPLQHADQLDRALVDEYKREWQSDPTYQPTVVALGTWDQRSIPSSYDNPLIRVTSGVHLVNFLVDGHHKIQAASELGKPISLLTFIVNDRFIDNKHEVALRLANTRYAQPAPKREPIKIVSNLPRGSGAEHPSLYVRLGYCVNATAVEIADLLRKDNVRPKRVVVSQDTWQILVQLHDNDLTTFHNLFTVTSSSATAPIYDEDANGDEGASDAASATGGDEGQQDAPAATAEGVAPASSAAAEGGEKPLAEEGGAGPSDVTQQEGDTKAEPQPNKQSAQEGGAKKGAVAQAPTPKGGAKPKPAAGKGGAAGGGKTRGGGKGGKPGRGGGGKGRGGKTGGGRKGGQHHHDEHGGLRNEEHDVADIAGRSRPKWLYLKGISIVGHNVIHPKIPIDEDLEEFNTWDERDLSIWTYNKRRGGGGGGALGNRGPRRNQWRENGGGGQQWKGNDGHRGGRNYQRGAGGRRNGQGQGPLQHGPGAFPSLGGPGPIGMTPMSPYANPGVVGPAVGFVGAGPMNSGGAPRGRGRPPRGGGRGGGRGRFVAPSYYPKFARPVVFAQEMPQELSNMQGIPLQPSNMIYLNNPGSGFPALGGEKIVQDPTLGGPGPVGAVQVPVGPGGQPLGAVVPGQPPQPLRTGGGGLCHFFFNTTVGCRYGEHCWFSHEFQQQN